MAPAIEVVPTARLLDRVGKGMRGAPRDALVADIAPPHLRGAALGLRQSLDTVGAFLGALVAVGLMLLWANDFRAVFWVAVIPGLLAVALLFFGVREPERQETGRRHPVTRARPFCFDRRRSCPGYRRSLGYRAGGGLPVGHSHRHMGMMTQGLLARMVADVAPASLRGTAYGFFNLIGGLAMLLASALAGLLWDRLGASFTFYAGAAFCAVALAGLAWIHRSNG